jgi:hypothetical protein
MSTIFSRSMGRWAPLLAGLVGFGASGCVHSPIDLSQGPAPLRMPRPGSDGQSFEDSLTGGEVFAMYCNQCHNARALGERPFANYQNVAAHMRVRAQFTGEEYEKLLEFLRRFHDVPQPTPPIEPSPKSLTFGQPVAELRDEIAPQAQPAADAQPQPAPAPAGGQPQPAAAPAGPSPVQAEALPLPAQPPAGP